MIKNVTAGLRNRVYVAHTAVWVKQPCRGSPPCEDFWMRFEVISQFGEGGKQITKELLARVNLKNVGNRLAS